MTNQINEITFTVPELYDQWTYAKSNNQHQYFIETSSHGKLVYIPVNNYLIVFAGTNREYKTRIETFLKSISVE